VSFVSPTAHQTWVARGEHAKCGGRRSGRPRYKSGVAGPHNIHATDTAHVRSALYSFRVPGVGCWWRPTQQSGALIITGTVSFCIQRWRLSGARGPLAVCQSARCCARTLAAVLNDVYAFRCASSRACLLA
jgi:hypothetical protein